jgi:PAS domain S-box-containing protein
MKSIMAEEYRILIVEDVPADAALAKYELKRVLPLFTTRIVDTETSYLEAIETFRPDLIISDFQMPEFDGLTALRIAMQLTPITPVIILTGSLNEDTAVECMKAGASDYVIKEHNKRLGQAVIHALEQKKIRLEKNKSEEALKQSEERFRNLFQNNLSVMLLVDPDTGRIMDSNYSAEQFYGWTHEQLLNMRIQDINTLNEAIAEDLQRAKAQKQIHFEFRHKLADGSTRDVEVFSSKITIQEKDYLHSIIHDITEKKKIFEELSAAKEKAEEADRLKTAFLHNISHEIRTPLNAIVGFSSILGNPELTADKRKDFLDIINTSNDQLLSIISGIIALATLEAGQEQIAEKETDINLVLLNVYEQFLVSHIPADVTFSYHPALPDELALVYIDPVKLMQILVNLVGNALKFTHKGKVRFGYTLIGSKLRFFIEDTGIGIPEEMHELIFERFRQVDNTATRKYGGTGLGLALSKGYVELLGGSIALTSEPGKGSFFSFTLPYKPVIKTSTTVNGDSIVSKIMLPSEKTILVAEDEHNNFLLINELLTSLQLKVIHVENGLEAVNICAGGNLPDLVLMDIKMPVMDGIKATKKIKKLNPGLPVVALTAYALEVEKKRIFESGCDDYLEKPIQHQALVETLLKYLTV